MAAGQPSRFRSVKAADSRFAAAQQQALRPLSCSGYVQQWLFCLLGIVLVALGVSVEVMAGLVTTAGEGIVLAVCRVAPIRFGNMKMIFDLTLVLLSVVLGLLCLGKLSGVREGTIAAAILVGQITKQTNRLTKRLESAVLS